MLTKLDLSGQQFDYLPEKVVSNCEKMREIDLSNNSLMMLQDDTFYNLTDLVKLNFSDKWIFVSIFGITVFTIVDKRWSICQYILLWSHQTVNMYGQNIEYVSFTYTSLFSCDNYILC